MKIIQLKNFKLRLEIIIIVLVEVENHFGN